MSASTANISDVTAALSLLLVQNIKRILGDPSWSAVRQLPPEKSEDQGDTHLNLHLYHVAHDGDGGPDLPLGISGPRPIATRPLPVKLFYVLTAHSQSDDTEDTLGQQALMGWGMKTFHDYPLVDAELRIDGTQIFPELGDRAVEISLRPVTPEDAIAFWSTDQVRTARVAAYYEVRTLLLPPEAPTMLGAPVSTGVALRVIPGGRPLLQETRAIRQLVLPAALGGGTLHVRRSPAVVALKNGAIDQDMRADATGRDLGDGSDAALVLRGEPLAHQGLPSNAAVLDPASNPGWQILVAGTELGFAFRDTANARSDSGTQLVGMLPGIYSVALRRNLVTRTESGIERAVETESNRAQFAVAPFIVSAGLDASDHVIVRVNPAYDVEDAAAEPQLSIGGDVYRRIPVLAGDPSDIGCYVARSGDTYEAVPLFDPTLPGRTYPVRLSVNGVDAQPFWMVS